MRASAPLPNNVIRVLHVVGKMDRAGTETWLMHTLRQCDRTELSMDFLVHGSDPGAYADDIKALGAQVLTCPSPNDFLHYALRLRRILLSHGPYQVVHSHVGRFSGVVMAIAASAGIPIRIAHGHSAFRFVDQDASVLRKAYLRVSTCLIQRFATIRLACSPEAGKSLFGGSLSDNAWQTLPCGIDLRAFDTPLCPGLKSSLGIPEIAPVLCHVGRFAAPKNHTFLLDVFGRVLEELPEARLLLIGIGPLERDIRERASATGIGHRVLFAGSRSDVPAIMRSVADVFLLPSLYEGLGLVLVEAQAAGLRSVASDCIPPSADVVPELVRRLSLSAGERKWAQEVLTILRSQPLVTQEEARAKLAESPFAICNSVRALRDLYFRAAATCSLPGAKRWST